MENDFLTNDCLLYNAKGSRIETMLSNDFIFKCGSLTNSTRRSAHLSIKLFALKTNQLVGQHYFSQPLQYIQCPS